jgi:hypothetical protein
MHNTINPATSLVQTMNYPVDSTEVNDKGVSVAGKPKAMEQILQERGLLQELAAKSSNGKVVDVCKACKKSQVACDKARKEAKARKDEIDGSGLEGFADCSKANTDDKDLLCSCHCCMQHGLSLCWISWLRNLSYSW